MKIKELIEQWFNAWEKGDYYNLPVSESFKHTSPFDTIKGKKSYLALIEKNKDKFLGYRFEIHDGIYTEDKACVRYTAIQNDFSLDVTEWYYIKNDLIDEVVAYYHIGEIQEDRKLNKSDSKKPKVNGIGGIFFFTDNPEKTKEWYAKNLGLATNDYGSSFEFRNANRPNEINYLQWSPFKRDDAYFKPSKKEFMINYRVQNLDELLKKLRKNGVTILDEVEEYEYGKFVHIMDPEGNKIELWEPVDSVFKRMGGPTTK